MSPYIDPAVLARFWSKVDRSAGPNECWPWQGFTDGQGYGHFHVSRGRTIRAHRFAFIATFGELPSGVLVCHHCDNPPCCNAQCCLFAGSNADNSADKVAKGRQARVRGERQGLAKLTTADVVAIRLAYAAGGITSRELGAMYDVERGQIGAIVRGRLWPDAGGPRTQVGQGRRTDLTPNITVRANGGGR